MKLLESIMELDIYYYLLMKKSLKGITSVFFHDHAKSEIDSHDCLTLEKTYNLHNVIILINKFSIKIEITTTIIYSEKNVCIR